MTRIDIAVAFAALLRTTPHVLEAFDDDAGVADLGQGVNDGASLVISQLVLDVLCFSTFTANLVR